MPECSLVQNLIPCFLTFCSTIEFNNVYTQAHMHAHTYIHTTYTHVHTCIHKYPSYVEIKFFLCGNKINYFTHLLIGVALVLKNHPNFPENYNHIKMLSSL